MIVYCIIFLLLIVCRIFLKNNKKFLFVTGIILWSALALRSKEIGLYDTKTVYLKAFNYLSSMSFYQIIKYEWMSDKLFYFVMKILNIISDNYQICIAVLAIPYVYSTMKFIEKKSLSPLMSVIVYISLYYMYATFLLRQVIAMGILLFAVEQIEKRDLKKFICIVLCAALFHKTALIFLIAYPFAIKNKFSVMNYVYIAIVFIIANLFNNVLIEFIKLIDFTNRISYGINNNIYSFGNNVSMFGLLITVCILIFGNIYRYNSIKRNDYDYNWDIYLNLSTLGSMLYACSSAIDEFYRISLYFSMINIIIVSNFLKKEKDSKVQIFEEYILIILFIAYFFVRTINNVNANPYLFFWQ